MNAEQLHNNAIVIDGLVVSKWSRSVFEDMQRGGLSAAMVKRGWSETRVRKVLGGNWLRVLREVWGA